MRARELKKIQYNQEKSHKTVISPIWGEAPLNGLKLKFALV